MVSLRLKDWREVINEDFSLVRVTQDTVRRCVVFAQRGYSSDARVAMGRIYTDAEYESRRERVLNTPLP